MNNPVDYIVYEGTMSRMERTIRRIWILSIILIVLLVGSNSLWLWYESQFESMTITQENEDGYNNFIGNDGDINYGTTDDNN